MIFESNHPETIPGSSNSVVLEGLGGCGKTAVADILSADLAQYGIESESYKIAGLGDSPAVMGLKEQRRKLQEKIEHGEGLEEFETARLTDAFYLAATRIQSNEFRKSTAGATSRTLHILDRAPIMSWVHMAALSDIGQENPYLDRLLRECLDITRTLNISRIYFLDIEPETSYARMIVRYFGNTASFEEDMQTFINQIDAPPQAAERIRQKAREMLMTHPNFVPKPMERWHITPYALTCAERERYLEILDLVHRELNIDIVFIDAEQGLEDVVAAVRNDLLPYMQNSHPDYFAINASELRQLIVLQRKYHIGELLRSLGIGSGLDRLTMRGLIGQTIRIRNIAQLDELLEWFTSENFSLSQEELSHLFEVITYYNSRQGLATLRYEVSQMVNGDHGHKWNDSYQVRQKPKRSLEILDREGITISIPTDSVAELVSAYNSHQEETCSLLDRVKGRKIATINGFSGSKAALTIHDIFDHYWLFHQLRENGLLSEYDGLLRALGNPQDTDIFSREGEIVAAVGFDFRTFKNTTDSHEQRRMFSHSQLTNTLTRQMISGTITRNQRRALHILEDLNPKSPEAQNLLATITGMSVELMEQRRKHGYIRLLDSNYSRVRNLRILDPEYIAFCIEINHYLWSNSQAHDEALLKIAIIVERYLVDLARGRTNQPLTIHIPDINSIDLNNTGLNQQTIEWLKENLGFAAYRLSLCGD